MILGCSIHYTIETPRIDRDIGVRSPINKDVIIGCLIILIWDKIGIERGYLMECHGFPYIFQPIGSPLKFPGQKARPWGQYKTHIPYYLFFSHGVGHRHL